MVERGFFSGSYAASAEVARRLRDSLSPRDHAMGLLRHTLLDQQFDAIKDLIRRNEQAEAATRIKFEELDSETDTNPGNEQLDNLREKRFWDVVFMGSAHSMSAVGMLAPFFESMFVAIFDGLRQRNSSVVEDTRRQRTDDQFWNPQIVFRSGGPKKDLVHGIEQLAEACGLSQYLPYNWRRILSALFAYRNNMLHNGFEWPAETVKKFGNRITSEGWPEDWFTGTNRGEEPWLYYMTPEFCTHCVELIDGIIDGVGLFLMERKT